jgi:hypothetical protein
MIGPAEIADMLSDYEEARVAAGLPSAGTASWPVCEIETHAAGARLIPFAAALDRLRAALWQPAWIPATGPGDRA